jgi:putative sigma-54 modulation protein
MQTTITFKQIDHSDAVKDYFNEKSEKIARYGLKAMELHITLTKDNHLHKAEAVCTAKDFRAHCEGAMEDIYASINDALGKVEKLLQKRTTKIKRARTSVTA